LAIKVVSRQPLSIFERTRGGSMSRLLSAVAWGSLGLALLPGLQRAALGQAAGTVATIGTIERKDPRFDRLVPKDAVIEKLVEGFDWSEGPVWMPDKKVLLFSDVPQNTVFQWKEGAGVSQFLKPSGYTGPTPRGGEPGSNGLLRDRGGRLILCQHGDRRVARLEPDGRFTTLVDRYEGKRLNSPNDGVFKSNGDLYFTDPPYGLEGQNKDPKKELPFNGVYRLASDGKLTLLTQEMTYPNGIAFSPDEKTLYVANSDPDKAIWMAFEVKEDGTLGKSRVFFDATPLVKGRKGLPDGMKVDRVGNLFATGPGGVLVFSPDGTHLGTLNTGEATANCGWGEDGSTLFITADMYLCRIKLNTKGEGF
jgi:gluconolactonase